MWTCPKCKREFKRASQNHFCKTYSSIDEYIYDQEQYIQPILIKLINIIQNAIPNATKVIAWRMPTWEKEKYIIHIAVNKNNIGIYVGQKAIENFKEKLKDFKTNKGSIHFKFNQEIPTDLISDIAKWCYVMDHKKQATL